MKVAIVTESFLPQINGVTNSVLRILEHLAAQGHEALVIAPESSEGPSHYAGFRVKRIPSLAMKGLIPIALPQKTLEPLLDGFCPDVIHLASPIFLGSYVAKIAKRMEIPTLSVYQTDIAGFARHYGLTIAHSQLKRWIAKIHMQTSRTLAPSSWACRDLESSGVENVHLWQRGVNAEKFNPTHRSAAHRDKWRQGNPNKKIVGYVGRLANEKRIDDLSVLDGRADVQLIIVGEGPARSKLERELPNAIFLGYQGGDDLSRVYASLDVFVHTGKHETFCQSIQEALASGVPVIAPHTGGPVDLVIHGKTGYLIDTAKKEELSNAFETLIARNDLRQIHSDARASVISRTWASVNHQLVNHYLELIHLEQERKNPITKELVA